MIVSSASVPDKQDGRRTTASDQALAQIAQGLIDYHEIAGLDHPASTHVVFHGPHPDDQHAAEQIASCLGLDNDSRVRQLPRLATPEEGMPVDSLWSAILKTGFQGLPESVQGVMVADHAVAQQLTELLLENIGEPGSSTWCMPRKPVAGWRFYRCLVLPDRSLLACP